MTGDPKRLDKLREMARMAAQRTGATLRLVEFTRSKTLEVTHGTH